MSVKFPTAGSAAALHRTAADLTVPSDWTFYCWWRRAPATGQFDTIGGFGLQNDPEIDLYWRQAVINDFQIERYTSGTRGGWRITEANFGPLPSATAWRFMAITQSGIATPTFYNSAATDSGPISRTVTVYSAPTGAAAVPASRRPIYGNSWFGTSLAGALNGDMACGGWHNVVLTEGELHEAMWRGITYRGQLDHRWMWNLTQGKADSSGSADAGTFGGSPSAVIDGPPIRPVIVLNRSVPAVAPAAAGAVVQVAAAVGGVSSVVAAVRRTRHIAALVAGASSATAAVRRTRTVNASIAAGGTITAVAGARRLVSAAIAGTSSVESTAARVRHAVAAVAAQSSIEATGQKTFTRVAAAIGAQSDVGAQMHRTRSVQAALSAQSVVDVLAGGRRQVAASIGGASQVSAEPGRAPKLVAASVTGTAGVAAATGRRRSVVVLVAGQASVLAVTERRRGVAAGVFASSAIGASVRRTARVQALVAGLSQITAAPAQAVPGVPIRPPFVRRGPQSRRPLALVRLRGPDRVWSVLGTDDARGIVAEGISVVTDLAGPLSCGFSLRRDPTVLHPDLAAFSAADIEIGGMPVWAGRIWETPGTKGDERSLSVAGRGWQSHLEDDVLHRFWAHQRLGDWRDIRGFPNALLNIFVTGTAFITDGRAITIGWEKGADVANSTGVGIMLDQDRLGGRARRIVVEYESFNGVADLTFYVRSSDSDDNGTAFTDFTSIAHSSMAAGPAFLSGTISGGSRRFLSLFLYYTGAGGTTGDQHLVRIRSIKLFRETGYESGNASDLKASEVIADLLASGALPLLSSAMGGITASSFSIPHLETGGQQSPRAVIDAANAYHGWLAGVDAGKRLYFRPKPDTPMFEVGAWSGAEFSDQSVGSAEEVYNEVVVQGQDASGGTISVTRTAAAPALDRLGVTRTKVLQVGAILNQASAEVIGDVFLAEHARSQFKGSLSLRGMGGVRTAVAGRPVHPVELLMHLGQRIRLVSMVDPDTGGWGRDATMVNVAYGHDAEEAQVSLDNERGSLTQLLERVGALQAVSG